MAPSRWSSQRLSYTRREVTEKKPNRKERERSRWPRRASSASRGAQPPSESGILLSTRDQWQARRARERLFSTVRMCPLVVRWWTNDTHTTCRKKTANFNLVTMTVLFWQLGEQPRNRIVTKKCAVWTSAKGKMSRRKKNDNRFVDVILTFLILGCSFFSTNCQQGTFLFFWKYTREKYPFRTANSSASYFAFRPRGRVTDVIRAILSWIKHRVNANVLADICVVEDLWDSRLSRLNFYYPTTGRPQILRSIIIYCCRVIYEQRRAWKFVQPRPLKDPVWFWQRNTSGMCRWYLCNPASRRCMTVTIHWVR